MTDQSTGNDDQFVLFADRPKRQQEIAQLKRLKVFSISWIVLSTAATLAGLVLIGRFVPAPLVYVVDALWAITAWGQAYGVGKFIDIGKIDLLHLVQDEADSFLLAWHKERAARAEELERDKAQREAESAVRDIEAYRSFLEYQARPKRGRPEITKKEASEYIDKADRAAAELFSKNGQRPTRQAIALKSGLTVSTLGRYEKIAGRKVSVNK